MSSAHELPKWSPKWYEKWVERCPKATTSIPMLHTHTHIHTLIHTCLFAMTWQSDCQVCHRAEDMIVVRVFWGSCNTSHTSPGGAAAARPRSISKVEHPLQLGWRLWEMCQMTSGKWFRREKAIGIFLPPKSTLLSWGRTFCLPKCR